jgi:hypothetical protein
MTRNIDHAGDTPMAQIEWREVELDGDLAPAFLGQPIHRFSGEGSDQR